MTIFSRLRTYIVEDWRDGWKWLSVRFQVLALAFIAAWYAAPDAVNDAFGEWAPKLIVGAFIFLALSGRFVVQGFTQKGTEE